MTKVQHRLVITADEIAEIYFNRSNANSEVKARQRTILDHYNGDVILPLPEMDKHEAPAVANLLMQGLDQTAMRIAAELPNVEYPVPNPGKPRATDYADITRRANLAWWEASRLKLQMRRRARHLLGYSETFSHIRWNTDRGCPAYHTRDPLTAYPSFAHREDEFTPTDCLFAYTHSNLWLQNNYPDVARSFSGDDGTARTSTIELVEYMDGEEIVLIVIAKPGTAFVAPNVAEPQIRELERTPNRIGYCPVAAASRINLGQPLGQFDGILGMYQQQAKLMALEVIAVQKGIFPDTWIIGNQGEQPKIVATADGVHGDIGIIRGGSLQQTQLQPGFMTNPTIDRLERNQRVEANIPAEFGGESTSNIRTGRRGEAVLSAAVDYGVQEAQEILARMLEAENRIAVDAAKAYAGNKQVSFYISAKDSVGPVEYTPNKHFQSNHNVVSYAYAGADINSLTISGGQMVQMGALSKRSFMKLHPMVKDTEREHDAVTAEQLESALLTGLQQQAAAGAIPPGDLARIMQLVEMNEESLAGAVEKVQREAQERQAAQVAPSDPEAQPGIANPGAGAEAGMQPETGEPPGLRDLLGAL